MSQKENFYVYLIVHQLRAPLAGMKWVFNSLLCGSAGEMSEEQKYLLEKGKLANDKMISLVNDLLDATKIEQEKFVFIFFAGSLVDLIKKKIGELAEFASAKGVKIIFNGGEGFAAPVMMDAEKIGFVIQNLVDNAVKYSKDGDEVEISIDYGKFDGYATVKVEDNGIGIPASQKDKIFEKFFRADNAAGIESAGSGLGLFIAKSIVEKHGGKIWFSSKGGEEGNGTVFWFTLPIVV